MRYYLSRSLKKSFPSQVKNKACDVCSRAKQTHVHFPLSTNKASNSFDLIHCDIWDPYCIASLCGAYYFFTIVDDTSRAIWVYLMKEASHLLRNFRLIAKTQFKATVKIT